MLKPKLTKKELRKKLIRNLVDLANQVQKKVTKSDL